MAYVLTQPQFMASAAADMSAIGSTINEATAAAAGRTTSVAAAAADEISAAVTTLFNRYARDWQAVIGQAAAFHSEFAQALTAGANAYANAEAAGLGALSSGGSTAGAAGGTGGVAAMVKAALADPAVTFVMDGSGTPIPPADFVNNVVTKYVLPNFASDIVQALALPAGEYPDSGIKDLLQKRIDRAQRHDPEQRDPTATRPWKHGQCPGLLPGRRCRRAGNAVVGPLRHAQLAADKLCAAW